MGSSTYEWVLDHLIRPGADHAQPWPYTQPAWIFTTRKLETVPGADIGSSAAMWLRCTRRW